MRNKEVLEVYLRFRRRLAFLRATKGEVKESQPTT